MLLRAHRLAERVRRAPGPPTTRSRGTALMTQWARLRARNPAAKLVCLDLQPYETVQAPDAVHVLNVGGFSDRVFDLIRDFADGRMSTGHWVDVIEKIEI